MAKKKLHQETCKEMEFAIKEGWVDSNLLNPQQLMLRRQSSKRTASLVELGNYGEPV